jgi:multidrug efflux pump subunit AcrB
MNKPQYRLRPDPLRCSAYGITPKRMAQEVKATLKGYQIGAFNLDDYLAIPIRLKYDSGDLDSPEKLGDIYLPTKYGFKQLRTIATVEKIKEQPYITRENLLNTIDVTALNHIYTIGQAAKFAENALADMKLPAGYDLKVAGSMADMNASNKRMMRALMIGLVLLYMLLLAMFKSFTHPFTIMAAIPLAVAGAMWGLLVFDKPMCKPAMMGIIFLGGTIVNNSILLLDFIINARKNGMSKNDAIIHSVRLRLRPILMTTVSTIVGLIPLIFEMAVGLERMSPLGIVAGTGLLVGTFLTMVVIPVVYSTVDSLTGMARKIISTRQA